jgi:hypothetical protein
MPSFDYNPFTRKLDMVGAATSSGVNDHPRKHHIDGVVDHYGVAGATEDNFVSFDSNGLPKDSGYSHSDLSSYWDRTGTTLTPKNANDNIDYGAGTISGTGDIYCDELFTSGGSAHVGDSVIASSSRGQVIVNRMTCRQDDYTLRSNFGNSWTARDSSRFWNGVAMTSDGVTQVACVSNSVLYKSTDSGKTWSTLTVAALQWYSLAMSADGRVIAGTVVGGQTQVSVDHGETFVGYGPVLGVPYGMAMSSSGRRMAVFNGLGHIYVSNDFGQTWNHTGPSEAWYGIWMSASGDYVTAGAFGGKLYVSSDGGQSWSAKDSDRNWKPVGMSDDGSIQAAAVWGGNIYVSTDYGENWSAKGESRQWNDLKLSYDGKIQIACAATGEVSVSEDYGDNWSDVTAPGEVLSFLATTPTFSKITGTSWNKQIYTSYSDVDVENDVNFEGSVVITNNLTIDSNSVDEFSTDGAFTDNSDSAIPTEKAVKTYVDTTVSGAAGASAHADLTGLDADDHTQYFITTGARPAEYVNIAGNVDDSPITKEGLQLRVSAANLTDNFTPGLRDKGSATSFGIPTMIGDNSITITDACTVYIDGSPTAGANMSITNPWAFYVNAGDSYFGGALSVNGDLDLNDNNVEDVNGMFTKYNAVLVSNDTGSTLERGTPVYVNGLVGTVPSVAACDNTDCDKMPCIGLVRANIANGDDGYVVRFGRLFMDTSSFSGSPLGSRVYVTSSGTLTTVEPTFGSVQRIGMFTKLGSGTTGRVFISSRGRESIFSAEAEHPILRMGLDDGHRKISFCDYYNNEVASIDDEGNLTISGSMSGLYVDYEPTPTSSGVQGQKYFGSGYLYECVDTNTWVRHAVATSW